MVGHISLRSLNESNAPTEDADLPSHSPRFLGMHGKANGNDCVFPPNILGRAPGKIPWGMLAVVQGLQGSWEFPGTRCCPPHMAAPQLLLSLGWGAAEALPRIQHGHVPSTPQKCPQHHHCLQKLPMRSFALAPTCPGAYMPPHAPQQVPKLPPRCLPQHSSEEWRPKSELRLKWLAA